MISQEVSEEVLLAAVADVEIPGSLDAFYRSEFPRMVNIAYALSGGRLAAEDLAQDAMIAAHRNGIALAHWTNPELGQDGE
jgi:DNA-directed RNA polymerase specialized sigma24 family protein